MLPIALSIAGSETSICRLEKILVFPSTATAKQEWDRITSEFLANLRQLPPFSVVFNPDVVLSVEILFF
jgi:hypothetical protein